MSEVKREHQWRRVTGGGSLYTDYRCEVCHLEYSTKQNGEVCGVDGWKMGLPCIEPVPETVSKKDLLDDLKRHGVTRSVKVEGLPGEWEVGFVCNGILSQYPAIEVEAPLTIEHGFAELLRWVRVRRYDPTLDHDFNYFDRSGAYDSPIFED